MRLLRAIVVSELLLLATASLQAQRPRMFFAAGLAGRHFVSVASAPGTLTFDGVSARVGVERIGRRFGWTASLGGDFATERNAESLVYPGVATASSAPRNAVVPGAIYRANAGLVISSDDQHRVVLSIGPALFTGRTPTGKDLVWGGLGSLTFNPFDHAPEASRIGLGIEASLLSSPLGRGVDWLMSPTVRITM